MSNDIVDILKTNGYQVVEGAAHVRDLIKKSASADNTPRCSGWRVFPGGKKCAGCPDCDKEKLL